MPTATDPFEAGLFPLCPATHDVGISRLFDLATVLFLLDCRPGDRVLDLGAGAGFSSEMLARLGYDVVAVDPDRTALRQNRKRPAYDSARIQGRVRVAQGVAERLPLADASVDGVVALNVLHHVVPELDDVVSELARVLRPGCRLVLCEPGLDHLKMAETQRAIREHGETDQPFNVLTFLTTARERGFEQAMLAATLQPALRLLPIDELDLYLSGNHPRPHLTPRGVVAELHHQHAFAVMVREGQRPKTSHYPGTLRCEIQVDRIPGEAKRGGVVSASVSATNTGDTLWLSAPNALGGYVTFGCKLLKPDGRLVRDTLGRTPLPHDVRPGERARATMTIPLPADLPAGPYVLQFDMVNELVCWFSDAAPQSAPSVPVTVT